MSIMKRGAKINCCYGCVPPKRCADPNCHTTCQEYLEQTNRLEEWREEHIRLAEVNYGLKQQRSRAIKKTSHDGINKKGGYKNNDRYSSR